MSITKKLRRNKMRLAIYTVMRDDPWFREKPLKEAQELIKKVARDRLRKDRDQG